VLNVRPIASLCSIPRDSASLFESHVPLRLCDRRIILSILIILPPFYFFECGQKRYPSVPLESVLATFLYTDYYYNAGSSVLANVFFTRNLRL
jgi:hypothetical protein